MTVLDTMIRGARSFRANVTVDGDTERLMPLDGGGRAIALVGNRHATYEELYRTQPWIQVSVNRLARGIGRLPIKVFVNPDEPSERERIRKGSLAELLQRPSERMGPNRLVQAIVSNVAIHGNHVLIKQRPRAGMPPTSLLSYNALYWSTHRDVSGNLWYAFSPGNGHPVMFRPDEVIHFRWWEGGSGIWAQSPLDALRTTLMAEDATQRHMIASFEHGARPSGIYSIKGPISKEDVERGRQELMRIFGGVDNTAKLAVTVGDAEWHSMSHTIVDSDLVNLRKLTREEVAAVYNIPPPVIGILDRATFCLPAHVPVFTEYGPRPIVDVKPGDRVWSHDGSGFDLRRVTRSGQTGVDQILRIKTQNRTLDANPTHPILVRRLVKVEGSPNPNVDAKKRAGQSRWHYEPRHVYVPAGEIEIGDILVVLKELPEGSPRQSVARMELFGLILGDGNVYPDRGKVSIARAEDAPYMDHYRAVIRDEFVSFGRRGNGRSREGVPTQPVTLVEGGRQTRFTSVLATEELARLGIGGTAHTKRVPGWVFGATTAERLAYLRRSEPPAGCEYSRVVEVENLPAEPVYDIEVEGTHNFVAAGVVVHNSNVSEQHIMEATDTMQPWTSMISEEFHVQLIGSEPLMSGQYLEFEFGALLTGDPTKQIEVLTKASGRPIFTANESRARLNMPPLDDPEADRLAPVPNASVRGDDGDR